MMNPKLRDIVLVSVATMALAACGADEVTAPNVTIPGGGTGGGTGGGGTGGGGTQSVTAAPASSCTSGTTDGGTIVLQNSRGTVRNCVLPVLITSNISLTGRRADGIMYSIVGRTDVGTDRGGNPAAPIAGSVSATLTVAPGVTVFANTPPATESTIVVNRGSRIIADGTAQQPIIFTHVDNLDGQVGGRALAANDDNLWGGIIINGRAPISDCNRPAGIAGGAADCARPAEGLSVESLFGGNAAADDSGTLRYVQINFTGVGTGGQEIQGLTTGGVGSATDISYIQIHNSRDDGIEVFGGTQNMDHLVMTGIADDSLDTDVGYIGAVQFVLAIRRQVPLVAGDSAGGQTILEIDSSGNEDAVPRQKLKLANFTLVQNTPNEPAIRMRGGADVTLANGIVIAQNAGPNGCFDVDNAQTVQAAGGAAPDEAGPPVLRSVVFQCNIVADPDSDTFEADTFANTQNANVNQTFTSTLATLVTGTAAGTPFINGTNETTFAAATSLPTISAFFQQVSYIGAVNGASDGWFRDWSCNSDVANLGGATACTDIRVF